MPAYLKRACACGPRQMVRQRSRRSALPSPVEARAAAPPRRPAGTGIPAYVHARACACVRVFTARARLCAPSGAPPARRAIRASTGTIRTCARASDPALRATFTWHADTRPPRGTHMRDQRALTRSARAGASATPLGCTPATRGRPRAAPAGRTRAPAAGMRRPCRTHGLRGTTRGAARWRGGQRHRTRHAQ